MKSSLAVNYHLPTRWTSSTFFTARRYASAVLGLVVVVCLVGQSVCHKPVSYRKDSTQCCKKIRVTPKIRVFPCGTLSQTPDLENFRHGKSIALSSMLVVVVVVDGRACWRHLYDNQCFFVTVRAGTAYRKIWRLVNNFFAHIIKFTVQKFQLFWVIFCIIIFFIELWHILILWLAKMPTGGMPVFTLIATGWRYRKMFFYKKSTDDNRPAVAVYHKSVNSESNPITPLLPVVYWGLYAGIRRIPTSGVFWQRILTSAIINKQGTFRPFATPVCVYPPPFLAIHHWLLRFVVGLLYNLFLHIWQDFYGHNASVVTEPLVEKCCIECIFNQNYGLA